MSLMLFRKDLIQSSAMTGKKEAEITCNFHLPLLYVACGFCLLKFLENVFLQCSIG